MSVLLQDVSRETLVKLHNFVELVEKWTPSINLISKNSVNSLWSRHILDSVQIFRAAPQPFESWLDIGCGGGFPGVVVAILTQDIQPRPRITLVESDARKSVFLRTALRRVGVDAAVLNSRIEDVAPMTADIVSARALTSLSGLLGYADRHMSKSGTAVFAKGVRWQDEVDAAKSTWRFDCDAVRSELEAGAAILRITGVSRV